MSSTISPNMNLIIPGVGTEPGPQWAEELNSSLTLVDAHDHTNGNGVKITPLAMNINTDLAFNNNAATTLKYVSMTAQSSVTTVDTVYVKGVDLFYVDGNGNDIRLTQSGSIAGTSGSIGGLVPPASVTYDVIGKTFVFQSNASIAANLDAAAVLLRNISPNSTFALTLQPPAALGSNYSLTLPALPASNAYVTVSSAGVMSTVLTTAADIINTANITNLAVTNAKIANSTIASSKLAWIPALIRANSADFTANGTWIVPSGIRAAIISGVGGGGGGGGGGQNGVGLATSGGGGGASGYMGEITMPTTPGETITIVIGSGGTSGTGAAGGAGTSGGTGSSTTLSASASGWVMTFPGGVGGSPGDYLGTGGGGGGSNSAARGGLSSTMGSDGGHGNPAAGTAGLANIIDLGSNGGAAGGSGSGGGGGGTGFAAGGNGGAGTPANGQNAPANSGGGGGGGGASTSVGAGAGGTGGSGRVRITYVPLV